MKKANLFIAVALLLCVAELAWFYPLLPDRMAVHYDAAGRVDGWGAKGGFFLTFAIVPAVVLALFGALRVLIRRVPDSLINLPHKEYWLAPERRGRTLDRLVEHLAVLVAMVLLLVDGELYLSLDAASSAPPAVSPARLWGAVVLFVIVSVGWLAASMRSFRRPGAVS